MAQDPREIDMGIVKDPIDKVRCVISQHTFICGRKYVVSENPMEYLHQRPTLLVGKAIWPIYKLPTQVLHHAALLLHSEAMDRIGDLCKRSWDSKNL